MWPTLVSNPSWESKHHGVNKICKVFHEGFWPPPSAVSFYFPPCFCSSCQQIV